MKIEDFKNSPSGSLFPTIDRSFAFVPHPLPPPQIDLAKLAAPLARAMHALGELSGIGRSLSNPELLIKPFSRAEAVASSKIEGTVTSASDLLKLELSADVSNASSDTREVNNYNRALKIGLHRISELPLSKRLLNELHSILLDGVSSDRGARIAPGELRRDQNWIGARTLQNARFVPPPPNLVLDLLDDFEKFANRENEPLPLLVKLAILHYQFETIHPYPDGNGRVGRLIIPLVLCEQQVMSQPLLYMSSYFESYYQLYIDLMYNVSKDGDWDRWIEFFLDGVTISARNAIAKIRALGDLRSKYMELIRSARSSGLLAKTVDALFVVPAITIPYATTHLNVSYNAAKQNLKKLVELGIISSFEDDKRPQWFFAWEIMRIARIDDE